jgi:large subunit ribosomal protein L9
MNSNGTPLPVIGQSAEVSVPPFNLMPALNVLPNIAVDLLIQLSIADPKPFGQQVTTNDSVGKIGHARIFIRPRQGTIQRCDASKYLGLKPVDGLGKMDTAVDVADGYARNYLIPRGLAIPASSNELKRVSELREVEKRKEMREEEKAREDARKLKEQGVTIRAKAGETGRLYGSITSKDVADAIREELGVEIDRRKIELSDPIREIGTFTATVKLFAGVSAEVAINVVSAEGEE